MNTQVVYKTRILKTDNTWEEKEKRGTLLGFVTVTPKELPSTFVNGSRIVYSGHLSYGCKEDIIALVAEEEGTIIKVPYYDCKVVN